MISWMETWFLNRKKTCQKRSFYILCEEVGPYIQNQTTQFRRPISVEEQVK